MKKNLKYIIATFMSAALIFSAASCKNDTDDDETPVSNTTASTSQTITNSTNNSNSSSNSNASNSANSSGNANNANNANNNANSSVNNNSANSSENNNAVADNTSTVTLPASVGTNEFAGKTFSEVISGGDASNRTKTWVFTDTTATKTTVYTRKNVTEIKTYSYSYDSTNKLLYLAVKSFSEEEDGETISYSNMSEYEALLKEWGASGEELEMALEEGKAQFATPVINQYTLGENNTITFEDYFDGNLPTAVNFRDFSLENCLINTEGCGLHLFVGEGEDRKSYVCFPTYKDGIFTGTLYESTSLGSIAGTYTTNGTGTSGCSIKITFTTLPEGVETFTTGTEYTLTN